MIENSNDNTKCKCITALKEILRKEPILIFNAFEQGNEFSETIKAIRDADPNLVLEGLDFWMEFILSKNNPLKNDSLVKIFEK